MSNSSHAIVSQYALSIVKSSKDLQQVITDLGIILKTITSSEILFNRWVSKREKFLVWLKIRDELKISNIALAIMNILIENNRVSILQVLIDELQAKFYEMQNKSQITIKTVMNLNEKTKNDLIRSLSSIFQVNIVPIFNIDESILGGFIAYGDSFMLDLSVQNRVMQVKKTFNIL